MAFDNPILAIVLLFVVVFAFFFILIYGILNLMEHRRARRKMMPRDAVPIAPSNRSLSREQGPVSDFSKFCLKCGTKIPRIAEYCPECGSQQIPV
jgi:hypothetical protein